MYRVYTLNELGRICSAKVIEADSVAAAVSTAEQEREGAAALEIWLADRRVAEISPRPPAAGHKGAYSQGDFSLSARRSRNRTTLDSDAQPLDEAASEGPIRPDETSAGDRET
jgi:hypothetical protein